MTRIAHAPKLRVDLAAEDTRGVWVDADAFGPGRMDVLRRHLEAGGALASLLCVHVVQPGPAAAGDPAGIAGAYTLLDDGVRFLPAFPFERGTPYRARLRVGLLAEPGGSGDRADEQVMDFTFAAAGSLAPPDVTAIFPSAAALPANLLRFTVMFSNPMQRGQARANVALLDAAGAPVDDALYNAPVELWDRTMRCLTVLLDPGRLKRGVGPNRALGPPLVAGRQYSLRVGAGMRDEADNRLAGPVHKHFRAGPALRMPVALDRWRLGCVTAGSRTPLTVTFAQPLDRALLSHAITLQAADGGRIAGVASVGADETEWRFTPDLPWAGGVCRLHVAAYLEDVCGNTIDAPFDRPLRADHEMRAPAPSVIAFRVDPA